MEYGYTITDTSGNETFFAEGCTCCSMSTGGLHESHCPYCQKERVVEPFSDEELNKLVRGQAVVARDYNLLFSVTAPKHETTLSKLSSKGGSPIASIRKGVLCYLLLKR